ncbi:MAG TPA: protease modulator HflK [Candidatus Paceibacterota bacterium]|nr:protease modulator HflK [Candidatus Paceibacterota bacterium]
MSDHSDHDHSHEHPHPAPETPMDAGSQALAEALRSSFAIVKVVMLVLVVVFLGSGFFQVTPQEQAIILRFGKPVGEGRKMLLGPGLHWSWPSPIDDQIKIPISEIQQVRSTVGWYATTEVAERVGEAPPGPSLNPMADGYAITSDGNIIHSRATLSYHIEDPSQYIFGFVSATNQIQNILNNALIQTVAQFKVDEILTTDVTRFNDTLTQRVRELLDQQNLGVAVDRCLAESIAPRQLKLIFDRVVTAGQTRRTALNQAQQYANQVLSQAAAESLSLTNTAEIERVSYVREVTSMANNFDKILKSPEYNQNPQLYVQKTLHESLSRSMTTAEKWVLPTAANGKNPEVRLMLNREPPKSKSATP